uniref:Uncharacterized protein n=1 Tax=Arion vulgaris TaxID=1028688 RepID=A0A0B7BPN7_9EUPU
MNQTMYYPMYTLCGQNATSSTRGEAEVTVQTTFEAETHDDGENGFFADFIK